MTTFPGGTAMSLVRVYDWPAADGGWGGAPHLHTVSTEGYLVRSGDGVLETLSGTGFEEHRLSPGTLLWFTPGTVHRLVNTAGDLEVLVVTNNAGLPEAGDAVLTFPQYLLADAAAYTSAATLPPTDDERELAEAARRRRDLAIDGYLTLREKVRDEGPAVMVELWRTAAALVRNRIPLWRELWRDGPLAHTVTTGDYLDNLAEGESSHLASSAVHVSSPIPERFGMCGRLAGLTPLAC